MKNERRDVVRDHDFDGIQEFDNELPRWWLGTFALTILVALFWWTTRQTFGTEPTLREQHDRQFTALMTLQEEKLGKAPTADEVLAAVEAPAALADGKATFDTTCFACHGSLGEGKIGPNLTDNHWIHGGKPGQIAATVYAGVPEKGMPTWRGVLKPEQIRNAAAYVVSLKGSNPPGAKVPEGTLEP
ncbi:MAG: c-type cytochrome [Ardenticatenales bacterium]|nr:c-type cytochrome [Ardenticatenales bacterium]